MNQNSISGSPAASSACPKVFTYWAQSAPATRTFRHSKNRVNLQKQPKRAAEELRTSDPVGTRSIRVLLLFRRDNLPKIQTSIRAHNHNHIVVQDRLSSLSPTPNAST